MEKSKARGFDTTFYGRPIYWSMIVFSMFLFMFYLNYVIRVDQPFFFFIVYFLCIVIISILLITWGWNKVLVGLSNKGLYTAFTGYIDWKYIARVEIKKTRQRDLIRKRKCIFLQLKKELPLSKKIFLSFSFFSVFNIPAICEHDKIQGATLEVVLEAIKQHLQAYKRNN